MERFIIKGPYVTPPQKLSSVGGLEALRRAADEEYERSGKVFIPRYSEGKRRFTGFAIAVIKGPTPPPLHTSNKVAVKEGNDEKAKNEIEGAVPHGQDERA